MEKAERGFWAGFGGDVAAAQSALDALDAPDARGRGSGVDAWKAALSGVLYHLDDGRKAPWVSCLRDRDLSDEGAARGAVLAADMAGRAAFLAFDGAAHRLAQDSLNRAAAHAKEFGALYCALGQVRQGILDGRGAENIETATELEARAAAAGRPAVVIEAAAFRALGLLAVDVDAAVATARRAARMARTESLPLPEYLANAVLARARRFSNRPHLAVHILRALARLAPDPWLPWVAWELTFAGAGDLASRLALPGDECAALASTALRRAREAASLGDRSAFDEAIRDGQRATHGAPALMRELDRFRIGADPDADLTASEDALAEWCRGKGVVPPFGLMGVALHPSADADEIVAYVVARPGTTPRRIFGSGVGFAPALRHSSRPGRTETAIAVLALEADTELDKRDFFAQVYGFPYRKELHQGPLEVLVHRLRKSLGSALELERSEEKLIATVRAPFSVPDPRCAKPLDDRLLKTLAEQKGGSAKQVAKALGVPLRTVQGVIKELAEEGACIAEKQGRNVVYRVEDTTFSEPTRQHTRRRLDGTLAGTCPT